MEGLIIIKADTATVVDEFRKKVTELSMNHYGSEASREMEFEDAEEFNEALKRAMEICSCSGIPVNENFKRVFVCSDSSIEFDYKLSAFAYHLVCLNGFPFNPHVAQMQVGLLRKQNLMS